MSRIMPSMSDGRTFTDYHSSWEANGQLMHRMGAHEPREYRGMLQHSADEPSSSSSLSTQQPAAAAAAAAAPPPAKDGLWARLARWWNGGLV